VPALRRQWIGADEVRRDPVTRDVALAVLRRDNGCVAVWLGESGRDCRGRLTLDHVKDEPRMGKRAPSDMGHLVALCEYHHLETGWATSHRPELREYLRRVNMTCSERDAEDIARILKALEPDMKAHPEEYTLEALQRRMPLPEEDIAQLRREHPEWPW